MSLRSGHQHKARRRKPMEESNPVRPAIVDGDSESAEPNAKPVGVSVANSDKY